jgi:acid phosphatase (class A)
MDLIKKNKSVIFFLLYLFGISLCASNEKSNHMLYIDEHLFNPETIMPWPPQNGSNESKAEIDLMKGIIAKLDQNQKDLAIKDALNLSVTFFADTLPGFEVDKLPKTKLLFEEVKYNAGFESQLFKRYFMKKRPYQEDAEIHACVPPVPDNLNHSYPSGHTTLGYAMGIILANLIPEKSKVIMERARLYGENRIYCGAHFPSDVVGGQVLGTLVATELLKNKSFQTLMRESREELVLAGLK